MASTSCRFFFITSTRTHYTCKNGRKVVTLRCKTDGNGEIHRTNQSHACRRPHRRSTRSRGTGIGETPRRCHTPILARQHTHENGAHKPCGERLRASQEHRPRQPRRASLCRRHGCPQLLQPRPLQPLKRETTPFCNRWNSFCCYISLRCCFCAGI